MPRGDRTGPFGEGPMTGRQMGYCAGYEIPGYMNPSPGWGRGLGRRFRGGSYGRGYDLGFMHGQFSQYPGDVPGVSEKTLIENQIRTLKDQLKALEDRLSKMKDE